MTDAREFIGPAAVERFRAEGEVVVERVDPLTSREETAALVDGEGPFDVVVANLEAPITVAPVTDHDDRTVDDLLHRLVHPLFWLFGETLPRMTGRGVGAVVVPTSATAIRSSAHPISGYQMARSAQIALVRSVAREVAHTGGRINAIAPNFIENPSYFPPETVADPDFQRELASVVPARRLGSAAEAAAALWWLASPEASYVVGTVLTLDGGWTLG